MNLSKKIFAIISVCLMLFFDFSTLDSALAVSWSKIDTPFGSGQSENIVFSMSEHDGSIWVGTAFNDGGGRVYRSIDGTTWEIIISDGLGDSNNIALLPNLSFDWGFIGFSEFDGYHYLSTANPEEGLQIWRSLDGIEGWVKVVEDGFDDPNNITTANSVIFEDELYVSTINDETGVQIWKTANGTDWSEVIDPGFGDENNYYASSMKVYEDEIYVFTGNFETGSELWKSDDGSEWTQSVVEGLTVENNVEIECYTEFDDELYAGTVNISGGQLWKTANGTDWSQVTGGFNDQYNFGISPRIAYNGYLYLGTYNYYGFFEQGKLLGLDIEKYEDQYNSQARTGEGGTEIWATNDGSTWEMINDSGFGDPLNVMTNSMFIFGNYIYAYTLYFGEGLEYFGNELWRAPYLPESISTPTPTPTNSTSTLTILPITGNHK